MPLVSPESRYNRQLLIASTGVWLICFAAASSRLRGLLINSFLLSLGSLLICLPVGTLLALCLTKSALRGRRIVNAFVFILLLIPLYIQATAWHAAIGPRGWLADTNWLSGWAGAIWVHGVSAIPWIVFFVSASLRRIPRVLEENALQDAQAWQVLTKVSLRGSLAGIAAGTVWVSVICHSEIAVTDLFRVRTFAEEVYSAASLGTLGMPNTFGQTDVAQLATRDLWLGTGTIVALVFISLAIVRNSIPLTSFVPSDTSWVWEPKRNRKLLSLFCWCVVIVMIGIPLIGLLGKAGEQITASESSVVSNWSFSKATALIASSPWEHRREFRWSLTIALIATSCAVVVACAIAWALKTRLLPTTPVTLLLAVSFTIPGPLLGILIIRFMNHPSDSILSPLTWCYDHTVLAPTVAQFLRALPLATLIIFSQLGSLSEDIVDSAASDGASWLQRFTMIALPWCWPSIVAAFCLGMVISIGELAATLLVLPPGVSTLSVRIFGLLHYGAEDRVSAICFVLCLFIGLVAVVVWRSVRFLDHNADSSQ